MTELSSSTKRDRAKSAEKPKIRYLTSEGEPDCSIVIEHGVLDLNDSTRLSLITDDVDEQQLDVKNEKKSNQKLSLIGFDLNFLVSQIPERYKVKKYFSSRK